MSLAFQPILADQPHPGRAQAILKAHPEIRKLMGRNRWTAVVMFGLVALQLAISWQMGQLGLSYWWASLLIAYAVGAFANHSLYVIIHEATHNLIFTSRILNKLSAIVADLTNVFPGAIGFAIYHLQHHANLNHLERDPDVASDWEARLVGNSWYRKAIWLFLFPFFQMARVARLKPEILLNRWIVLNAACVVALDLAVIYFFGWNGLLYLFASMMFALGLHPLGARWIQEHYTHDDKHSTFSYYGVLNWVALNMGYHNEHHDFPTIPWNRLPRVKAAAPGFYDSLTYRPSWTRLLLEFIFDPRYSLYARNVRLDPDRQGRAARA
jgi:sphingolipid delta-4 desaturase